MDIIRKLLRRENGYDPQQAAVAGTLASAAYLAEMAVDLPLLPHEQFVLQDEFEELQMVQLVPRRLLKADIKGLGQPGQPELMESGRETFIHRISPGGTRKGELSWNCLVKQSRALQRCNLARDNWTWAEADPLRWLELGLALL